MAKTTLHETVRALGTILSSEYVKSETRKRAETEMQALKPLVDAARKARAGNDRRPVEYDRHVIEDPSGSDKRFNSYQLFDRQVEMSESEYSRLRREGYGIWNGLEHNISNALGVLRRVYRHWDSTANTVPGGSWLHAIAENPGESWTSLVEEYGSENASKRVVNSVFGAYAGRYQVLFVKAYILSKIEAGEK